MKKIFIIFLSFLFLSCNDCFASKFSVEKQKQIQTHIFNTSKTEDVLFSAINTLQDSDFEIREIDFDLGFIRAKKTFKSHYVDKKRVAGWSAVFAAATAYTVFSYGATAYTMYSPSRRIANEMKNKTVVIDSNVFVEKTPDNKTRLRFNLVEKIHQNADGFSFMTDAPIRIIRFYKPYVYNEFFAQVEKNLTQNF